MASDPVSAGRKGGSRNTPAQKAARKRNGFQRVYPAEPRPEIAAKATVDATATATQQAQAAAE